MKGGGGIHKRVEEAGIMFRGNPGFSSEQLGLIRPSRLSRCFIVCGRLRFVTFPERMTARTGVCICMRCLRQLNATPTVRKYDHRECRRLQKPQLKSPTEHSNTAATLLTESPCQNHSKNVGNPLGSAAKQKYENTMYGTAKTILKYQNIRDSSQNNYSIYTLAEF